MSKIWGNVKNLATLFKETFIKWNEREPFNNSTVIAYYAIFSLPGLLVIIINLAGYFFGTEAVTNQISTQIGGLVGGDTAKDVQAIIAKASEAKGSTLATILGVATLLFGATGVFYQVQQMLNRIWGVKPKPKQKILKLIKDRVFSFGLILIVGFLLLISLVLSAGLSALSTWVSGVMSDSLNIIFKFLDIIVSVGVVTVLFAAIFKFLPDAEVKWRNVWVGAFMTAVLFVIAKFALGIYFGKSNPGSTYGAAGSIILIMLWVTYAGLILLYGAEFTKIYADAHGEAIRPTEGAEYINEAEKNEACAVNEKNLNGNNSKRKVHR
jgi:membrane protein